MVTVPYKSYNSRGTTKPFKTVFWVKSKQKNGAGVVSKKNLSDFSFFLIYSSPLKNDFYNFIAKNSVVRNAASLNVTVPISKIIVP